MSKEIDKSTIVEMTEADGSIKQFSIAMAFEVPGLEHPYVVLMPVDEDDEEALIYRAEQGDKITAFLPIETEEENEAVMKEFNRIMDE